jgi:hypothetical protein
MKAQEFSGGQTGVEIFGVTNKKFYDAYAQSKTGRSVLIHGAAGIVCP